jgi:hypothetical protein
VRNGTVSFTTGSGLVLLSAVEVEPG